MKQLLASLFFASALCVSAAAVPFEFYPFDSGVGRGKPEWTPERQAAVLKELGYSGIGYNYQGPQKLAEWQKAFDAQGLKIFSIYVASTIGKPLPKLDEALALLKGRETFVWLNMAMPNNAVPQEPRDSMDKEALEIIRSVCVSAKQYGVNVVLYGHKNLYIETAEDGLRLLEKAGCENLFISMNLCHELAFGNLNRLEEIARKCAPHLRLVSINGAEVGSIKKILRLDQGDFDPVPMLKALKACGYKGPVGLQCFQVPGDVRENLVADMDAWKKISAKVESSAQ